MKRILVVSDLHVGSPWGLSPHPDNGVQRKLFRWWKEMISAVGHVDACVVNGDTCEGTNRKQKGEHIGMDVKDQILGAVDMLSMIDCEKWYGTQGTGYHTDNNPSSDWYVTDKLQGQFGHELVLNVDKKRFHFCHKVGVSSSGQMYHGTPLSKEQMVAKLNKESMGGFDVIARSHAHYFYYTGSSSNLAVITPCWKGRDPHAQEHSLKWNPEIGYVYFDVEDEMLNWYHHVDKFPKDLLFDELRV